MSPVFTINFRREAYQREVARVRRRMIALGVWVSYFGIVAVLAGLFVLNGLALQHRVAELGARIAHFEPQRFPLQPRDVPESEMANVERVIANPRRWHTRLARLAALTPPNLRLSSLVVNPEHLQDVAHADDLVITGTLKPRPGEDRMRSIMAFAAALQRDRGFSAGYSTVKLMQSQAESGPAGEAEFTIECR